MSIEQEVISQAEKAVSASREIARISSREKDQALNLIADKLIDKCDDILAVNEKDMEKGREAELSRALLDRLMLTEDRIKGMAAGIREVAQQEDPIGESVKMWKRPNGLQIGQVRVPIGVIGIIYEARPNVTVDVAGLCLKSGNAVLMRGGSYAYHSNAILTDVIQSALQEAGLPKSAVQLVRTTDRQAVEVIFKLNNYLDLLIPRGGAELIQRVVNESRVPVVETGVGNCHIYVDKDADFKKALAIVYNAKTSRPAVCNAAESMLIHKDIAAKFLPEVFNLLKKDKVELRGCENSKKISEEIKLATEADWGTEYLDYIMSVKIVNSFEEASDHIYKYGTKHSEAIVTENYTTARKFLAEIDAAAVYVNASTRFTDGSQFGMGAEIGISTQKLHARGPMGLKELTSTKYVIMGDGQIRE